ncbi:MAG: hypothetical protein JXB42_08330 [Deltaproteobacteria bacterium]|nr:hypothetical protein [Deltaproteobacteria bacterium]
MKLLESWENWQPSSPPFVLDEDLEVLDSQQSGRSVVTHCSWQEAIQAPDFCTPGDRRLHLGLLPQPFFGDVRRASVYILLLNPGLGPHDYYGEYEVPEYRAALLATLKQQPRIGTEPFLFLDPQFSWHGGFSWWHGKLAKVIERLASDLGVSFAEARTRLGASLASIELLPYHSSSFKDADGWLHKLRSVHLARAFVKEFILPRVQRREAIVIVTRKVAAWNLPQHAGVIAYSAAQARAAHLTPDSPGGRAILEHLGVSD